MVSTVPDESTELVVQSVHCVSARFAMNNGPKMHTPTLSPLQMKSDVSLLLAMWVRPVHAMLVWRVGGSGCQLRVLPRWLHRLRSCVFMMVKLSR